MRIPAGGRVLAIDWGTIRIGLAISDDTQLIATPLEVLHRRTGRRFPMARFLTIVAQEHPVGLVVGLPLDDDGLEGTSALAARELGRSVAARTGLPIDWIDESFTTATAITHRRESAARRPDLEARGIDAAAAAEILQAWLDRRR